MQYLFVVCRKKSSMKDSVLYCCSQCPSGPRVCQERNYFNLQKCAQLKKKKRKENKSLKTEMLNAKEIKHGLPHCNTLGGFPITAGLIQSESQALLQKTAHLPFIWVREVCLGCSGADRWGCRRRGKKKQLAVAKNLKRNQLGRNATHHHVAVANHVSWWPDQKTWMHKNTMECDVMSHM